LETGLKEKFDRAWRDPASAVKEWKDETGGKALGLLLTDAPFELVHAAGALPVAAPTPETSFQHADRHLQGFACSYSRTVVELCESGKLDFLDGLIVPYSCDTTRCLDLIFKFIGRFEFHDCLRIPKRNSADGADRYFKAELTRLGEKLSEFTGSAPDQARLKESIALYNRVRALLDGLRDGLRRRMPGISAPEYFSAVRASMVLAPERIEPMLDAALEQAVEGEPAPDGAPGVVVAGKVPEPPGIIEAIERSGLRIIEDHLVVGGRWAAARVAEDQDPWEGLVARQQGLLPFSGIWDNRPNRASYLIERVRETGAAGAVFLVQKFCEIAEIDFPGIKAEADKSGTRLLVVETDYREAGLSAIKTRLEAFAELLARERE